MKEDRPPIYKWLEERKQNQKQEPEHKPESKSMKTKEIEVWVDKENIEGNPHEVMIWHRVSKYQAAHLLKAKLIIELPEKKIEITESQFDEAVNYAYDGENIKTPVCVTEVRI